MAVADMHEMFLHELGDVYDAEHRILDSRDERIEQTINEILKNSLQEAQERSRGRIQTIERAYEKLGEEAQRETCDVSQGLVSEAQRGSEKAQNGAIRDYLLNAAILKEELYKVAAYRNLIASARFLEQDNGEPLSEREAVAQLLEQNLRDAESTAQTAERNTGELLDVAKKAGSFQKIRESTRGEREQDKGLLDKAKDKFSSQ